MEPGTKKRCATVDVVLPSGVHAEDFSVHVEEGGTAISIDVKWPLSLDNLVMLHSKWMNDDCSVRM